MKRMGLMVLKDLQRQIRSPLGMLLTLSFPLVFAGLIALTFGGGGGESIPRVKLLVEDRAEDLLSGMLLGALGQEQAAQYFDVRQVGEDGMEILERGEAAALLRIPEGFAEDILAGTPITLQLVRNPAQSIMPEIAEQAMAVLTEVLSSASRMLREPMDELSGFVETEGEQPTAGDVAAMAVAVYGIVEEAEQMLFPPVITFESVQLRDEEQDEDVEPASGTMAVFLFILPGISVWALFLVGDNAMRDLLVESTGRTLRRQLACPVSPWEIVVGKALYTAVLAGISLSILTVIGWIAAPGGIDVVGFVVLSLAVVLAVTGYSAAVYGVARTENQGATFSGVALLVFAFLGGSFMPLDNLPDAILRVSPYTPFYWGTTGYNQLIVSGGGLGDIWTNVGVLSVFGVAALFLGAALMKRKVGRGAER